MNVLQTGVFDGSGGLGLIRLKMGRLPAAKVEHMIAPGGHHHHHDGRRRMHQLDQERLTRATLAICTAWNRFVAASGSQVTIPNSPDAVH
jgi:hypothetical protein